VDWCGFWMLPSICSWECDGQKAADTCCSQNPVDYCCWHYSASAVVFTKLVELALLREISRLPDVEKQRLQATAPVPSVWAAALSIVAPEEGGVRAHL